MKFKFRAISLLMVVAIPAVQADAETNYFCTSDLATGFSNEDGVWIKGGFKADQKYLVRRLKDNEKYDFIEKDRTHAVLRMGGTGLPSYTCYISVGGYYICDSVLGEFKFSPEAGAFIATYTIGYWEDKEDTDNTPYIEIGVCAPM